MMEYSRFRNMVEAHFIAYMPEEYSEYEVRIADVNKTNSTLDGLSIFSPGVECNISPTIYVNDLYAQYQKGKCFEQVMEDAAFRMVDAFENQVKKFDCSVLTVNTFNKERVVYSLLNTKQNESLLKDVPNRSFLDLSIVYRYIVSIDDEGMASVKITHEIANSLGLSEEMLFDLASNNIKKLFPTTIKTLQDTMIALLGGEIPDTIIDEAIKSSPIPPALVISNSSGINGASAILEPCTLDYISKVIGGNVGLIIIFHLLFMNG